MQGVILEEDRYQLRKAKGRSVLTLRPLDGRPVCLPPELTKDDAVIGIRVKGESRKVVMTALIGSFPHGGNQLGLKFLQEHAATRAWNLPRGLGNLDALRTVGYEYLPVTAEVVACVIQPKSVLAALEKSKHNLPLGFARQVRAGKAPLSALLVEFDDGGRPTLRFRRDYEQSVLGSFEKYASTLDGVWPRITGKQFESVMKSLFEELGFAVEHVQLLGGADGGVDLTVTRDDPIVGTDRYAVQCKNLSTRSIGSAEVQKLRGAAAAARAQRAILVTTSRFSSKAIEEAERPGTPVKLIDGPYLATLVMPYVKDITLLRDALTN